MKSYGDSDADSAGSLAEAGRCRAVTSTEQTAVERLEREATPPVSRFAGHAIPFKIAQNGPDRRN